MTVKAYASQSGSDDSPVATAVYLFRAANPLITTAADLYASRKVISITCRTPDATIRYTTNGSVPTSGSGTVYSSSFSADSSVTVKAIAYKTGLDDSSVVSRFYSIYTDQPRGAQYLGAGQGVRFSVYATNASAVFVAGEFNRWDGTANRMVKNPDGVWVTTVASAVPGQMYKFVSTNFSPNWIADPYARSFNQNDNDNGIILDHTSYTWGDGGWVRPDRNKLVVYEMHIKDFTRNDSQAAGGATYGGVIDKIPYLKALGVNAVEFMPVQEWPGGWYSWGYNNCGYFAPENSLANNQADGSAYTDFKRLVDALHQAGIAVILDVVYNHTANDNNYLWNIDSALYFEGSTPWGNRLALEKPATAKFVYDNLRYWLDEFHVDGFRFDATEYIDIAALITVVDSLYTGGYAGAYFIFEEFNGAHNTSIRAYNTSKNTQVISSWGTGYKSVIWDAVNKGRSGDLGKITHFSRDDGWNHPDEVINYFSSHDEGTLQGRHGASKQSVKAAAAHLLTSMGIPMIWMRDEVMRLHYGNHPPSGQGIEESNNIMEWNTLRSSHQDLFDYYAALIKLRIDHPALRLNLNDPVGGGKFSWNTDWSGGFVGYTYKNVSGDNNFVVLINYSKTEAKNYDVSFPNTGTWYLMCDGQSAYRYSPGVRSVTISSATTAITVPANTAYIYMSEAVN